MAGKVQPFTSGPVYLYQQKSSRSITFPCPLIWTRQFLRPPSSMSVKLNVSVIIQPLIWISFSDYFRHTGGCCGYWDGLGPKVRKSLKHEVILSFFGHYGGGVLKGMGERRLLTHTSASPPPSYFLSSQDCATFLPLISSVWVLQRGKKNSYFPVSFRGNWRWDINISLTLGQGRASRNVV